ncbi:MAG: PAS domain S-box protein [Candidatus Marinimicrobia bacterium]|nr:PAS domain S-box protein [Candidatus Neomarinimicrobiota bacterium]
MAKKSLNINDIESVATYQSIVEGINEFVMIFDLEGIITFANQSAISSLGYKKDDLLGKPLSVLFESDRGKNLLAIYRDFVNSNTLIDRYEMELKGKRGRAVHLEVSGKRMYSGGKIVGAVSIGRDISSRITSNKVLSGNLGQQSFAARMGINVLSGVSYEKLIQDCIAEVSGLLDVKAAAFLQLDNAGKSLKITHSVGWVKKKSDNFELVLKKSGIDGIHPEQTYTLNFDRSNNKRIPAWFADFKEDVNYAVFVPISPDDNLFGAILVHAADRKDIDGTKVKFVEQIASLMTLGAVRDRNIKESGSPPNFSEFNPDLVMKINLDGKLLYANPAVSKELKIQGLGKGDWAELLPEIHNKKMRACIDTKENQKAESIVGYHTFEFWYTPVHGEESVILFGRDVADKDEALGELMLSEAELITSHKEINELHGRERTMKEHLAYAERLAAIGQMGAKIAHELNNPLQIISARAELIAELSGSEKIRELSDDLQTEIQHVIEISSSYMRLGKQSPAEMESLNINETIMSLMKTLGTLGHIKYLNINTNYEEPLPTVYGDREKVIQVFRNLIINAAHSMEKTESKTLTVTTSYQAETSSVVVEVTDTGTGIKKKDLATIFDPYFTTKEEGVGTGIGLVIVRDVVEMEMGGTIKIDSAIGRGTTFTISFPAEI